eukprot:CAMPEP_0197678906 /NCGR_PEP_ID=MMETSP1338-20131121/90799_1 /TAXON_ID=43686 ORGANISM="Pelagodinium beii, Strain RCC1491" /NCGR_SAMPLE_ID=MMETSP1338 /ASSEMBLY_ACC=CAM_ASM_000754 /LENGTH=93 /DNA_ID=CAMNT_0043259895 /DNA_START=1 /DNA_END=278 /DNA_ORIENTATION=+
MSLWGSRIAAVAVLVMTAHFCTLLFVQPAPARGGQGSSTFAGQPTVQVERNVAMNFFGDEQKQPPKKKKEEGFKKPPFFTTIVGLLAVWGGIG